MRLRCLTIGFILLAAMGCGRREPQPPSIAELTTMLQSDDANMQVEAAHWVMQLGPKAAETAPALIGALKSPQMTVRQNAAQALGHVGDSNADKVVPALIGVLGDEDATVRRVAADSLGKLGPAAAAAIPALEKLATQPDPCNSAQSAIKKIRS